MTSDNSWLQKSVQDFFSHCNWLGRPLETQNGSTTGGQILSLTSSVGDFFRAISWEGVPEVGAMPAPLPIAVIPTSDSGEVTLEDLLDLF